MLRIAGQHLTSSFEGIFKRRFCSPDVVRKTIPHLSRSIQERTCSPCVLQGDVDRLILGYCVKEHIES